MVAILPTAPVIGQRWLVGNTGYVWNGTSWMRPDAPYLVAPMARFRGTGIQWVPTTTGVLVGFDAIDQNTIANSSFVGSVFKYLGPGKISLMVSAQVFWSTPAPGTKVVMIKKRNAAGVDIDTPGAEWSNAVWVMMCVSTPVELATNESVCVIGYQETGGNAQFTGGTLTNSNSRRLNIMEIGRG